MSETHICFERIGDVFRPGDVLAEWVATVGIAANDFATVGSWIAEPDERARKHPYLFRVATSHFFEIAKYLALRRDEPSVAAFVASMGGDEARGYQAVLDTYERFRGTLSRIRDNSAFHYGPTEIKSRSPLIRQALRAVADEPGVISFSDEAVRFGFAGEAEAAIFTISCGGTDPYSGEVEAILTEVAGAIIDFGAFAEAAVRQFLAQSGVSVEIVPTSCPTHGRYERG